MSRRDLSSPRRPSRRPSLGIHYDTGQFGDFSERAARFLGTPKYIVVQTIFVAIWITLNVVGWSHHWDPYPFIALNLVFSTQAAYAAPLILLAQNRQADRDRAQAERDRAVNARTLTDTEFLARELASIRLGLDNVATTEDIREITERLDNLTPKKKS